jgi:cysteine desulfurase
VSVSKLLNHIYLDYNASAPLRPEALTAMTACLSDPHNASSVHGFGRNARKIIEEARLKVAALVNAPSAQVIFNSGATEGNNTVLKFFKDERILISAIEHPSVFEPAPLAEKIPVTPDGIIDLNEFEKILKQKKTGLVSVMMVNNETGAVQPIQEIAALAHSHGALMHCDAVQAAGRIKIDMATMGIDFLTISAHKIGGPQGVGALALGLCGITPILLHGGGQEKNARAGTENVAAIAGLGAAAECALLDMNGMNARLNILRARLEGEILKINPGIAIHAANAPRVCNTSMFSVPAARAETMLMAFDLDGVALSNGSACSSGTVRVTTVLKAMGCDDALASSALRVSMGWNSMDSDIDRFIAAFQKIHTRMNRRGA